MIIEVNQSHLPACVAVIRDSFRTVAEEFGITPENAPRFTAFATTEERLSWHLNGEHRPMFAYVEDGAVVGYYSLALLGEGACELNNLAVLPGHRHKGIGTMLLNHAFGYARGLGCSKMNIGIVEENRRLRQWYENFGFIHTGTRKFDFFRLPADIWKKDYNSINLLRILPVLLD